MAATLPRAGIVRRKSDLRRLMKTGRKAAGPLLSLRYSPQPEPGCPNRRVAFLLPGTIKGAVGRSRLKRRLREAYRRNQNLFPAGFDFLVFVRPEATLAGYAELEAELLSLARKAAS